jgi:hypothetical protein
MFCGRGGGVWGAGLSLIVQVGSAPGLIVEGAGVFRLFDRLLGGLTAVLTSGIKPPQILRR